MQQRWRRWLPQTWQRWSVIALAETALGLALFAIAPGLLNSNNPLLGFAIILGVPVGWGSSVVYASWRAIDARHARSLLIAYNPNYRQLRAIDLLEIPSKQIHQAINTLNTLNQDETLKGFRLSPLDLIKNCPIQDPIQHSNPNPNQDINPD